MLLGAPQPGNEPAESRTAGGSGCGGSGGDEDGAATGVDERRRRRNRAAATRANERRKWLTVVLARVAGRVVDLRGRLEEVAAENEALRKRAMAAGLPLPPIIGVPPDVQEEGRAGAAGVGEMEVSVGGECG